MHNQLHEYVGVIHVHSTYSDGSRPIPEIATIAEEVDLDFVLMTDHNTLQAKRDGLEGWHGDVLVGVGYEINDENDLNHYLAFNLDKEVENVVLDPFKETADVDEANNHFPPKNLQSDFQKFKENKKD